MSPSHARPRPDRPRWALGLLITLLGLAVVLAVVWAVRGGGEPAPLPQPTSTPSVSPTAPRQATLLVQVSDDDGYAVNNALLTTFEAGGSSASVGVQPQLLVTTPGGPQLTFGRTLALPESSASAQSLSAQLGVRVDGTWALGRLAFAGLVDAVGGVEVEVPETFTAKNPDGSIRFSVPKGVQTLDGPQAALYVQTLLPGEDEDQRMVRFQEVLRQIEVRLPPDRLRVETLLGSLGSLSRSTVPTADLAAFLLVLRADINLDRFSTHDLPVRAADIPGLDALRLDFVRAETQADELFPDARTSPGPDSPLRVLVQDGGRAVAVGILARQALTAAGLVALAGGEGSDDVLTESLVLVPADVEGADAWGAQVAEALGLPATSVRGTAQGRTTADVVVVLGADYRPTATPSPEPSVS